VQKIVYSPSRIYLVFRFLLTLFLIIRRREQFLFFKPLSPEDLRKSVSRLGTSFIKLSQVLATRSDFFSEEYLFEMKKLHDQLPPMSSESFKKIFSENFDENSFESFEREPIASASIGQVHKARYRGVDVAVKLRRYGVEERVKADVQIIRVMLNIFRPLFSKNTENSIEAVLNEFSKMILDEVNLSKELSNLQKFREIYSDSGVSFPEPFPEMCSRSAVVMSFEEGYRFDDKKSILESGIDFRGAISTLVNFYTEQMLLNGFFHADPHPGNLLIRKDGSLVLLDFGMVKRVPNESRVAIIELIKSANERDFELYVSASRRLGTLSYEAKSSQVVEFAEKMFEIFSNDNLNSESMQKLAFEVLETTKDIPFKLPSDAIYILRASAIIEGLGTTYIENFNGIKDILPILQESLPRALNSRKREFFREVADIPSFVKDFRSVTKKMNLGELSVELHRDQIESIFEKWREVHKSEKITNALYLLSIFALFYSPQLKEFSLLLISIAVWRTFR
jgi:predicted unusual protein kinase regulating ubiquinone biosynthesis (AarF/ABC1/UbiB family)